MRSGLGWRSLDPGEATADVHSLPLESLRTVIENARCAEARRVALIRLGDEGLMEQAALSDPAPLVRRRMARELHNADILRTIADEDPDDSVRAEAGKRLGQLQQSP
jgi:hypothetical protein